MIFKKREYKKVEKLLSARDNKSLLKSLGKPMPFKRDDYRIVVIDDEGFDSSVITKYDYDNVTVHSSFEGIKMYSKYDVILCDIQGIGENVQSKHGGVEVAIELKKQYPQKVVALYSAKEKSNIRLDYSILDGFIDKSLSGSELVTKIDEMIKASINPTLIWDKIQDDLRINNVRNKEIAIIEDIYCKSLEDYTNHFESIEKYNFDTETLKLISSSISTITTIVGALLNVWK